MAILRTPTERFDNLKDYPFLPHYVEVGDNLQMHYVDEGHNSSDTLLMLHGEPTWSYLYRKMIPILVEAGYCVIAPDLIGFGKSDKFDTIETYSYQNHVDWLLQLVQKLDLQNITLVCQDYCGVYGVIK